MKYIYLLVVALILQTGCYKNNEKTPDVIVTEEVYALTPSTICGQSAYKGIIPYAQYSPQENLIASFNEAVWTNTSSRAFLHPFMAILSDYEIDSDSGVYHAIVRINSRTNTVIKLYFEKNKDNAYSTLSFGTPSYIYPLRAVGSLDGKVVQMPYEFTSGTYAFKVVIIKDFVVIEAKTIQWIVNPTNSEKIRGRR